MRRDKHTQGYLHLSYPWVRMRLWFQTEHKDTHMISLWYKWRSLPQIVVPVTLIITSSCANVSVVRSAKNASYAISNVWNYETMRKHVNLVSKVFQAYSGSPPFEHLGHHAKQELASSLLRVEHCTLVVLQPPLRAPERARAWNQYPIIVD